MQRSEVVVVVRPTEEVEAGEQAGGMEVRRDLGGGRSSVAAGARQGRRVGSCVADFQDCLTVQTSTPESSDPTTPGETHDVLIVQVLKITPWKSDLTT